jgi:biopolymer transport protein ExbD
MSPGRENDGDQIMKRKTVGHDDANLPITPFLDLSFQLLFFFIVSFNPNTAFEGHMALALPSDEQSKQARDLRNVNPFDKANPNEVIKFTSEVTVFVHYHDNDPNNPTVSVEDPRGKTLLGSDVKELIEHLLTVRKDVGEKEKISVQGDGNLKWGNIVQVMDACRSAGFDNVSFAAPPGFNVTGT